MNFYTKKRSKPNVPIITLIDILAILLIFFIVTTTFKKKQSLLKINLPKSGQLTSSGSAESRVPLAVTKNGEISLGQKIISLEEVSAALTQLKKNDPNAKLEMKADEDTAFGIMVKVWDAATLAGVEIEDMPVRIRVGQ